jgi:hypothetical protein
MKITPGHIDAPGEHVVLVGPIQGSVTLDDGEIVNVTPVAVVARDEEHAEAIAHAVGQHYADNGHPTDPEFTYNAPKRGKKA